MTQDECIKEVLKSFEFYHELFVSLKRETWFYYSLLGRDWGEMWKKDSCLVKMKSFHLNHGYAWNSSVSHWWTTMATKMIFAGYPVENVSGKDGRTWFKLLRRAVQRKCAGDFFPAYFTEAVLIGRKAGLDNLTICYALCRKIHDACCNAPGSMAAFNMKEYVQQGNGGRQTCGEGSSPEKKMDDPSKVDLKSKLSFIRMERQTRRKQFNGKKSK